MSLQQDLRLAKENENMKFSDKLVCCTQRVQNSDALGAILKTYTEAIPSLWSFGRSESKKG